MYECHKSAALKIMVRRDATTGKKSGYVVC